MRISDWSSDVCSSDLPKNGNGRSSLRPTGTENASAITLSSLAFLIMRRKGLEMRDKLAGLKESNAPLYLQLARHLREQDRKRVVEGKSVSVRVDHGGRRSITKKNTNTSEIDTN